MIAPRALAAAAILLVVSVCPARAGDSIAWQTDATAAFTRAASAGRPVLIYFRKLGDPFGAKFERESLGATEVVALGRRFEAVVVDVPPRTASAADLTTRYGVDAVPTLIAAAPDGALLGAVRGARPTSEVRAELQRALTGFERRGTGTAGSRARPSAGVYALDALVEFDVLEGAAFDSSTGAVSLFGRRQDATRFMPIAYVDCLATALATSRPAFTLSSTPVGQAHVARIMSMRGNELLRRILDVYDETDAVTPRGRWLFGELGASLRPGRVTRLEALSAVLRASGDTRAAEALAAWGPVAAALKGKRLGSEDPIVALVEALRLQAVLLGYQNRVAAGTISEAQAIRELTLRVLREFIAAFGVDPAPLVARYDAAVRRGVPWTDAVDHMRIDDSLVAVLAERVVAILRRRGAVHVPPEILQSMFGGDYVVRPEYRDLPPDSLLARIALEADLALKAFDGRPPLATPVPGFLTKFEWDQTVAPLPDGEGHSWISPGRFEVEESEDGRAMRFVRTPMLFHIQRYEGQGAGRRSVADPGLARYAAHLSERFEAFAAQVPEFHRLRECQKVIAVARWLQERGAAPDLPGDGRGSWSPPATVPGAFHFVFHAFDPQRGRPPAVLTASGGIDLTFPTPVAYTRASGPLRVPDRAVFVPPTAEPNETLRRILADTVSVPRPPVAGWIRKASVGDDYRATLTILAAEAGQRGADPVALQVGLDALERKANLISFYDRWINAETAERIDAMREIGDVANAAQREMETLRLDAMSVLSAGLSTFLQAEADLASDPDVKVLIDELPRWQRALAGGGGRGPLTERQIKRVGAILGLRERLECARDTLQETLSLVRIYQAKGRREDVERLTEKLQELGAELLQHLDALRDVDPRLVERAFGRTAFWWNAAGGLTRMAQRTLDMAEMNLLAAQLNARLGDKAVLAKQVQERQRQLVNEYLVLRRSVVGR